MATVKGPLMSLDASGSIGTSIVFSKWKGRNYVRRHAIPSNPKSAAQLGVRAMLKFLTQYWDSLSTAQKTDWETRAAATNISPFNAFVSYNMTRFGLNLRPSKLDPATLDDAQGGSVGVVATAGVRSISLASELDDLNQNWGIALYRSLIDADMGQRTQVVHIFPAESLGTYTWLDFPLTPGTEYFYQDQTFSAAGKVGSLTARDSATPTA